MDTMIGAEKYEILSDSMLARWEMVFSALPIGLG
jgi:hypothetical protein